jgi:hypothetical protein
MFGAEVFPRSPAGRAQGADRKGPYRAADHSNEDASSEATCLCQGAVISQELRVLPRPVLDVNKPSWDGTGSREAQTRQLHLYSV